MGAAAAAIIIRKEKDLVAHFQQARAVSAATAQTLGALRIDEGIALRRLRERAVIREAAPGTFYLDEPSWAALRYVRRRLMTVMLLLALAVAIAIAVASRGHVSP
jgi:hypothetical protein